MESQITNVVLDACVLYPWCLRDFLVTLAAKGTFRAKWTFEIHDEWMRSLLRNRPDLDIRKLERQRDLMIKAIPDSIVDNYQHRISSLSLPDPNDRHVLAAAIHSKSQYILTKNLKDFPAQVLDRFGIKAMAPDEFTLKLIDVHKEMVAEAIEEQRARCKNPPYSLAELRGMLSRDGLALSMSRFK